MGDVVQQRHCTEARSVEIESRTPRRRSERGIEDPTSGHGKLFNRFFFALFLSLSSYFFCFCSFFLLLQLGRFCVISFFWFQFDSASVLFARTIGSSKMGKYVLHRL